MRARRVCRRYLDSTFCSFFHQLKAHTSPETVLTAGRYGIFGVWLLCMLVVAWQIFSVLRAQCTAGKGVSVRPALRGRRRASLPPVGPSFV